MAGPSDTWPMRRGFEPYYGFRGAETDQSPQLRVELRRRAGQVEVHRPGSGGTTLQPDPASAGDRPMARSTCDGSERPELQAEPLPHMGWNTVAAPRRSELFAAVAGERFYFVHSYAVIPDDADTITKKIRKAKTDPEPLPDSLDGLGDRPEARNLVNIYAALADTTPEAVIADHAGETR